MRQKLFGFACGALFAVGLALAGMTSPAKVIAFLDVTGAWDPSLAFVMGGALAVLFAAGRLRPARPLLAPTFAAPPGGAVDTRLLVGAALFGAGWGLSGFCPGPALASVGSGVAASLWFVPAMLAGMLVYHLWAERAPAQAPVCG